MTHPADWYPDPATPGQQRYWDGQQWTDRTQQQQAPATKKRDPIRTVLTVAGVILVAGIGISFMGGGTDEARDTSVQAAAPADPERLNPTSYPELSERDFQLLIKDPEAAAGQKHIIYGEVTQLDAATGARMMRVNATATPNSDAYGDNVIVNVDDEDLLKPVVADDQVKLFVTVDGALKYDTQIGGSTTVPAFTAAIVEVLPS